MRHNLLLSMALLTTGAAFADGGYYNDANVFVIPDFYCQKIKPDGTVVAGQTTLGDALWYNLENNSYYVYSDVFPGNGNIFADNGTMVGTTIGSAGVLMRNGRQTTPAPLKRYYVASIEGITPDCTRIVGLLANEDIMDSYDKSGMMYYPYYMDMTPDGSEFSEPHILPTPDEDFLGMIPQYCSATWISNDGKTILGNVCDWQGRFFYPIVYKQDERGEWSYIEPSRSLYNQTDVPLGKMPLFEQMFPGVAPPEISDFMTWGKQDFLEDLDYWLTHQDDPNWDDMNPYNNLYAYMDQAQMDAYNQALDEYNDAVMEFNKVYNQYWLDLAEVMENSVFFEQNSMTMNETGTVIAAAGVQTKYSDDGSPYTIVVPYRFNLEEDPITIEELPSPQPSTRPNQILPDGTMVVSVPVAGMYSYDETPPVSYVLLPGATEYLSMYEYMLDANPIYAAWMKDYLTRTVPVGLDQYGSIKYEDVLMSGWGNMSNDKETIVGGVAAYYFDEYEIDPDIYAYMSYVYKKVTAGVDGVEAENSNVKLLKGGLIVVDGEPVDVQIYDLTGKCVFNAQNLSGETDSNLTAGVYVVVTLNKAGERESHKVKF